jgi:hypothetical protein
VNGLPPHIVQALAAGDKVDHNDVPFDNSFPYVALPHNQGVNTAGPGGDGDHHGDGDRHDDPFGGSQGGDEHGGGGLLGLGHLFGGIGTMSSPFLGVLFGMVMLGSGAFLLRRRSPLESPATS